MTDRELQDRFRALWVAVTTLRGQMAQTVATTSERAFTFTWPATGLTATVTLAAAMRTTNYGVFAVLLPPEGPIAFASDPADQTESTFILTAETPVLAGATVSILLRVY